MNTIEETTLYYKTPIMVVEKADAGKSCDDLE